MAAAASAHKVVADRRALLLFLGALVFWPGCGERETVEVDVPSYDEATPYNVLLISLDTLRADHLGIYGYDRPVSPHIDAFAGRSVRFERAYSHAPWTTPAHAAMLTSLYPSVLGLKHYPEMGTIGDSVETMAEYFQSQGLRTHAVTEGGMVHSDFGFAQGFEEYTQWCGNVRQGSQEALKWLKEHEMERFFLFFHTYDIHRYEPPQKFLEPLLRHRENRLAGYPELAQKVQRQGNQEFLASLEPNDLDYLVDLYDASIRSVDFEVGRILLHLENSGLLERTLVVITSDHGEEFLERDRTGHGYSNFEEQIRVPLIFFDPRADPGNRQVLFRHLDLLPTLAEALHLPSRPEWLGGSLYPCLIEGDGAAEGRERFSYSEAGHLDHKSIQSLRWKLIHSPRDKSYALYDLANDPGELQSVLDTREEVARPMRSLLDTIAKGNQLLAPRFAGEGKSEADLPKELLEQLRSLGYAK